MDDGIRNKASGKINPFSIAAVEPFISRQSPGLSISHTPLTHVLIHLIKSIVHPHSPATWQQQLQNAFTDLHDLCDFLQLSVHEATFLSSHKNFPIKVTRDYANCMKKGDPNDPLLLQVVPQHAEKLNAPGFMADPVGDLQATIQPGIIKKYTGRLLLITTAACAIHCRYCFRRNFPYADNQLTTSQIDTTIDTIHQQNDIHEIILSGGDPLVINDDRLQLIISKLEAIPHLKRIRFHTRLPIVLPDRVTPKLLDVISNAKKQIVFVVHANHANELSNKVTRNCMQLSQAGALMLNQSVLLKHINDSSQALCELSESLSQCGIQPYYLHLLDKAQGTAHFEVSTKTARTLMEKVHSQLPGYLVPKLVREVTGDTYKRPVF